MDVQVGQTRRKQKGIPRWTQTRTTSAELNNPSNARLLLRAMKIACGGGGLFAFKTRYHTRVLFVIYQAGWKQIVIVQIYQVGEDGNVPFIAMQFLRGESLQTRLKREGKLDQCDVVRIGREVATGLSAAHKRDLIHRDINVRLPKQGFVPEAGAARTRDLDRTLTP